MKQITAIIQPSRLYDVLDTLRDFAGAPGVVVTESRAFPRGHADPRSPSHGIDAIDSFPVVRLEAVVPDWLVASVVEKIRLAAHTGNPGDGKIFVLPVDDAIAIRTGIHDRETNGSPGGGQDHGDD